MTWPPARETASANIRNSSPITCARSSPVSDAVPATTSPSFCGCSSDPRNRRFGQTLSCSPADGDHFEVRADRGTRRADQHGVGSGLGGERVFGNLGVEEFAHEEGGRLLGIALHEPAGGREQCDHAVEVPVRLVGDDAAPLRLLEPALRQTAALPGVPEQLFDGGALRGLLRTRAQGLGEPARAAGRRRVDGREPPGRAERLDDQLVGGPIAVARQLLLPQREPQASQTHAVEAAERTDEQIGGERGGQLDRAQLDADQVEQLARGEIVAKRPPGDRGLGRNLGDRQRPGQRGHAGAGAHHDGHAAPRHAVEQVPLAELAGQASRFGRGGRRLDADDRRRTVLGQWPPRLCEALHSGSCRPDPLGHGGRAVREARATAGEPC